MYCIASVLSLPHGICKKNAAFRGVGSTRLTYYSFRVKFFLPEMLHNRLDLEMA
jgi:hypothetical protein